MVYTMVYTVIYGMVCMGGIYLGILYMVYTIQCMLYTMIYARHTTVYIIGIYHGILNDIYIYTYIPCYIPSHLLFIHLPQHPCPQQPPQCRALLVAASTSELLSYELQSISPYASAQLLPQ
jgi:hypothetical protein